MNLLNIDNQITEIQNGTRDLLQFNQPEHAGVCSAGPLLIGALIVCNIARESLSTSSNVTGSQGTPSNWKIDEAQEALTNYLKDVREKLWVHSDGAQHKDKLIKQAYTSVEEISRERIIQIGPLLNELKQMLTSLSESLNKEDDPELLKAVNYAMKEYPCLLHCLKDGSSRLMSVFANIRNHNLDPKTYLCDVFRRIGKTAKEDLETLLAHLWTPQAVLNL